MYVASSLAFPSTAAMPFPGGLALPELFERLAIAATDNFSNTADPLPARSGGASLSAAELFQGFTIVSSGAITLNGTFLMDLDRGIQSAAYCLARTDWDIVCQPHAEGVSELRCSYNSALINLGIVPFGTVLPSTLPSLPYNTVLSDNFADAIDGLPRGNVLAVRTTAGNYAKVLITSCGEDLSLRWITYRLTSAYPLSATLCCLPENA